MAYGAWVVLPDAGEDGISARLVMTLPLGPTVVNELVLADLPMANALDLSLAARYSDYDTVGSDATYKVGAGYRPIRDILFRGTYSQGFRAPSINELYQGARETSFQGIDPCNGGAAANAFDSPNGPVQMIAMALYRKAKTGEGCAIEIPMFENLVKFVLEEHMYLKTFDPPLGETGDPRLLDPLGKPIPTRSFVAALFARLSVPRLRW